MQITKQTVITERIRDIADRSRSLNICLIGIPEKDNKAKQSVKEIIEENFAALMRIQVLRLSVPIKYPVKLMKRDSPLDTSW